MWTNLIMVAGLTWMSRSGKTAEFETVRAGYLSFRAQTHNAIDTEGILDGSPFDTPVDPGFCRAVVFIVTHSLKRGTFDHDVVRFALVMKNGHTLAIDQDGGVQIDGLSFALSRSGFGQVVEFIAASCPKRAFGKEPSTLVGDNLKPGVPLSTSRSQIQTY